MPASSEADLEFVDGHPSCNQLDALFLNATDTSAATSAHVAACSTCNQYIQALQHLASKPLPTELSARIHQRSERCTRPDPSSWQQRLRRGYRSYTYVAVATAAAAVLPFVLLPIVRTRVNQHQAAGVSQPLREKGGASVAVYLQRGQDVLRWEERTPIRVGDRLMLEVSPWPDATAPEAVTYVSVASTDSADKPGELRVLFRTVVSPSTPTLLPTSWQVDSRGHSETLVVIWSRRPLPVSTVSRSELAARQATPDPIKRLMWRELILQKE